MRKIIVCLLALLSLPSFALEGIEFYHNNWSVICDNAGTCRMVGTNFYENYNSRDNIMSLYFEIKFGEENVIGKGFVGDRYSDYSPYENAKANLIINDNFYGEVQLNNYSEFSFTNEQTQEILKSLVGKSLIELKFPEKSYTLSADGATAVMLKIDEFQKRLDTKSAFVRKGNKERNVQPPITPRIVQVIPKETDQKVIRKEEPEKFQHYASLIGKVFDHEEFSDEEYIEVITLDNRYKLISIVYDRGGAGGNPGFSYYILTDLLENKVIWYSDKYNYYMEGMLAVANINRMNSTSRRAVYDGNTFIPVYDSNYGYYEWDRPILNNEASVVEPQNAQ